MLVARFIPVYKGAHNGQLKFYWSSAATLFDHSDRSVDSEKGERSATHDERYEPCDSASPWDGNEKEAAKSLELRTRENFIFISE